VLTNQQPSLLFPSKLGRLKIKPHKQKKRYETKAKKEKTKGDKKIKSKEEKRQ
jgi:hypothetical protein